MMNFKIDKSLGEDRMLLNKNSQTSRPAISPNN